MSHAKGVDSFFHREHRADGAIAKLLFIIRAAFQEWAALGQLVYLIEISETEEGCGEPATLQIMYLR